MQYGKSHGKTLRPSGVPPRRRLGGRGLLVLFRNPVLNDEHGVRASHCQSYCSLVARATRFR